MNHRGSTLLELLVAFSLAAILITLTAPSLGATGRLLELAAKQERVFQRRTLVQDTVLNAIKRTEILKGIKLARISPAPSRSFSSLPRGHQPADDSTILSVLEIERNFAFGSSGLKSHFLLGCIFGSAPILQVDSIWLGVSLSGVTTFRGNLTLPLGKPCQAQLNPRSHGLRIEPEFQEKIAHHALVAYLIRDAYTLYRDNQETFRRVSLVSSESQPIAHGVTEFVITEQLVAATMRITIDNQFSYSSLIPAFTPPATGHLELTL